MGRTHALAATALATAGLLGCGDSTGPGTVVIGDEWRGQVASGDRIEIKGVVGSIGATAASGNEVVVSWTKRGVENDPAEVQIEVVEHTDGVTICAVYPDVPGNAANECLPGQQGNMSVQNNDVEVTFTVRVPAGVEFVGRTVTGDVEALDLASNALGFTVTGNIDITTTGLAEATTVTGSITASIGLAEWDRDLEFTTVTGSVTVEVPANTNAEVRLSSVSGSITSDFPLSEVSTGNVQGTIGSGGRMLTLSSVTGNVALRRGG